MQRKLGLKGYQMAEELRITPEWYSKLIRGKEPLSEDIQLRLDDFQRRKKLELSTIYPAGKKGRDFGVNEHGPTPMVASRLSLAPGAPSTRADCEVYFAELLDAAERSGNPNAFPVVHDRLKKKFPITEWDEEKKQT